MKILGTGLDGLVGSRIVELLKDRYEFESSDVDITDRDEIIEKIRNSNASIVLHLAAKTSVDGCEEDKGEDQELLNRHSGNPSSDGASRISLTQSNERFWTSSPRFAGEAGQNDEAWNGRKTAWAVNVVGTKNVVDACEKSKKKLIYISTDFVFDGSQKTYNEIDKPNPINWYGKTKYEGEEIVKNSSISWVITRIAYPYRTRFVKKDFVRILIEKFKRKESLQMVTDHIMSPTFIDDIAFALDSLIKNNSAGIFHIVGSEFVNPYDAACKIAKIFGLEQENISKTTRSEYFRNRAPRPFHLALKNDKIQWLGVKMRGFEEGLREIKRQMANF